MAQLMSITFNTYYLVVHVVHVVGYNVVASETRAPDR